MAKKMKTKVAKTVAPVKKETKPVKEEKVNKVEKEETKKEEPTRKISSKQAAKDTRKKKAQRKTLALSIVTTILIVAIMVVALFPVLKATKFGLDLQGGFEILYKVNSTDGSKVTQDMVTNTYSIILKRIDILGVSEPEISIEGNNIRVQLAGVTDEKEAKSTLSQMANLTFRNSSDELIMDSKVLRAGSVKVARDEDKVGTYYLLLDIADIDTFHEKTEVLRAANEPMVIWLDWEEGDKFSEQREQCGTGGSSRCISYAYIQDELTTNNVRLTGNFTQEEAEDLAELINSGSLPTKLEEISSRTVNASFGEDALEKTFLAGVVGIIAIMLLLILVYRFSGFITSVGILAYTVLVFLIFNLIGGRLTLPSIAAVVIGIGMAVDASVISFTRIKEELRAKYTLEEAFARGNKNSFSSIFDANITTLIAAFILFWFGESSVKGFATMLLISILVTFLIMVCFVRFLLKKFVQSGAFDRHLTAFIGIGDLNKKSRLEKFSFTKWNPRLFAVSLLVLIVGTVYVFMNGFNLGIDFKGGSSISLQANVDLNKDVVAKEIESLGYHLDASEQIDDHTVYITVTDVFEASDNDKIDTYFAKYDGATASVGAVSNIVKKQLLENAIWSLALALIGLIIYVTLRFTFSYGVSSVFALMHDCLIVVIAFSLFKLEVTSIFIAAILSIIGYSINNTIVAFDRIRENKEKLYHGKIKTTAELQNLVDVSLKEVISRSLLTSITTLLPVISLIFLGSHEIINFNYALLIGLIAGTYSSLFLALHLWYLLEKRRVGKPEKKKWYEVEDKETVEELKVKGINC